MSADITYIAETNFRGDRQKFGIKRVDRRQHTYVIGKTGVGKTGFLKNMALQDINNGEGLAIIDPHGEFVEEILEGVPPHRMKDVVYFNPADMEHPVSFNIMDVQDPKYKHLIASGLIGIFTKIWANVWSARMEYILANCILALLDTPGTTLLGIPRMLVDRDYRQKIINNLQDPVVKSFWVNEYEEWEPRYRNEAIAPVQNKVGQFLNVAFVRNIVGQAKTTIDIDEIMNNRKILLVNVSKGRIGEDNAAILGAMLITKIQLSAMERVRIPEDERKDFYLYVDEFQNFATDSFVNILSEARKYRLDLIIAHQYVGQLVTDSTTAVRDAVFGNVGTMVSFRVGAADAEFLEPEFTPEFLQDDLIRLANRDIYLKLMIDGITSRPFSGRTITLAPIPKDDKKREEIIKISRTNYARPRTVVEDEINRWAANQDVPSAPNARGSVDLSNPQGFYKNSDKSNSAPRGRPQADGQTTLYDAVCSNCNKPTKVVFPPTEGRAVYCKSCLKKMKSGAISPSPSVNSPAKKITDSPEQTARAKNKQQNDSALADLGIEFAPPSGGAPGRMTGRSLSAEKPAAQEYFGEEVQIQDVSFHRPKSDKSPKGHFDGPATISPKASLGGNKPGRKEINLADLRKALEDSLAHKPDKPAESPSGNQAGKEPAGGLQIKPKSAEEELRQRLEEEQSEDKVKEDDGSKKSEKKPLDPGKPVKL